jgi:flagellar biosynthetic protein FlhF
MAANASPRTFRGSTPRAALDAVKMAYGPEAIVLATREISGSVFRNREIEVLASPPTPTEPEMTNGPHVFMEEMSTGTSFPAPSNRAQKLRASSLAKAAFQGGSLREKAGSPNGDAPLGNPSWFPSQAPAHLDHSQMLHGQTGGQSLGGDDDLPQTRRPESPRIHIPVRQKVPSRRNRRETMQLERELDSAQQASEHDSAFSHTAFHPPQGVESLAGPQPPAAGYVESLKQQLISRGMDASLASEMAADASMLAGRHEASEKILQNLVRLLSKSVRVANAPWGLDPSGHRRVMALVGPTGVGKTTTAAKIAARAVLEHDLRVALVTIDTYRIGAIGQLTKYGELLGIPTYVARDRSALVEVLTHTRDQDLVIIDTAGRSPSDTQAMRVQSELLRSCPEVMLHVVVAAGTSARQLKRLESRYHSSHPERLIVTKLDESEGDAALINIASRLSLPISCVTDGQRVPEDLHWWNIPTIVQKAVGQ